MSDVLIIGGGIIGTACAYELGRRGVSVTLIDRGKIGFGCSYGNAGWISACLAHPLPMPGMLREVTKWLLDPDSPLYIKPCPNWELVRWLTRFAFCMNRRRMRQSVVALTGLARYSLQAYQELDAQHPGAFGFNQKGLLMVAQSLPGRDAAVSDMELVRTQGIPGQVLNEAEIRQMEPAITAKSIHGGVYYPQEAYVEPLAAVRFMADRAVQLGAKIHTHTEVFDISRSGRFIEVVRTTRGDLRADQIILASGTWSNALARMLRLRVPVLAGKGYAVTLEPLNPVPKFPLMLLEKKVAVTPRKDSVRLAGTLELVNMDESITRRRVDAIVRGAREFLNVPAKPKVIELWRGLRPCTPDGVPVIGRPEGLDNLVIATGHQMLGLLSAPGTARLVADLITGGDPVFDPWPFRPSRF